MKKFVATVEERYVWDCPYCGNLCESLCEDPEDVQTVECEHCGEEAMCDYTERQYE